MCIVTMLPLCVCVGVLCYGTHALLRQQRSPPLHLPLTRPHPPLSWTLTSPGNHSIKYVHIYNLSLYVHMYCSIILNVLCIYCELQIPLPRSELPKTFSATRVSLHESQRERERSKQGTESGRVSQVELKSSVPLIVSHVNAGEGEKIDGASTKYFIGTEVSIFSRCVCVHRKKCTDRESNPGLPRGRREFYH